MDRPMEPNGKNAAGPQEDRNECTRITSSPGSAVFGCLTSFSLHCCSLFPLAGGYKMVASSFTSHVVVLDSEWGLLLTSAQRLQCEVQSSVAVM